MLKLTLQTEVGETAADDLHYSSTLYVTLSAANLFQYSAQTSLNACAKMGRFLSKIIASAEVLCLKFIKAYI